MNNGTRKVFSLAEMEKSFNELLIDFQSFFENLDEKKDIKKTKLYAQKKLFSKYVSNGTFDDAENDLSFEEFTHLAGMVVKYLSLGELFDKNTRIKFDADHLHKVVLGKNIFPDSDQQYNETFFEFSMAIRFFLALGGEAEIELDDGDNLDIIINRDKAVECKYIHSKNKIYIRIKEAINQINGRLLSGKATHGFIALDFTDLIERNNNKIRNFIGYVLEIFCENHERAFGGKDLLKSVISNANFSRLISIFICNEMEIMLHESLKNKKEELNSKMNKEILAIIYQTNFCFPLKYKEESYPFPIRVTTYYTNPNLTEKELLALEIEETIHALQVGL